MYWSIATRNDQKMPGADLFLVAVQLELISKGMTRLKGIAVDQSNEVKLQGVMIDREYLTLTSAGILCSGEKVWYFVKKFGSSMFGLSLGLIAA